MAVRKDIFINRYNYLYLYENQISKHSNLNSSGNFNHSDWNEWFVKVPFAWKLAECTKVFHAWKSKKGVQNGPL